MENTTKSRILDEALVLFAENGYKNVSMQDICDSSGMSKGGIYRHFSSKSELLLSLLQKEKRVFQDIQEGKSAIETLNNLLKIYFEDMKNCKKSLAFIKNTVIPGSSEPSAAKILSNLGTINISKKAKTATETTKTTLG